MKPGLILLVLLRCLFRKSAEVSRKTERRGYYRLANPRNQKQLVYCSGSRPLLPVASFETWPFHCISVVFVSDSRSSNRQFDNGSMGLKHRNK
jgi:hypothetical protein